ncbi:ATP-binding protein [Actinoplanes sp. CA-054009]
MLLITKYPLHSPPSLATAILDRLLHHCDVVPINGPSYRLKNRLTAMENVA